MLHRTDTCGQELLVGKILSAPHPIDVDRCSQHDEADVEGLASWLGKHMINFVAFYEVEGKHDALPPCFVGGPGQGVVEVL